MNKILVILVLSGVGCSLAHVAGRCNSRAGWKPFRRSCYKLIKTKRVWNDAADNCKKLGGDLATITSQKENNFVKRLARKYAKHNVWIGGLNVGNNRHTWRWMSTFKKMSFTNWNRGQPQHSKDENCVGLHKPTGYNWHDYYCNRHRFFSVCEKKIKFPSRCCQRANRLSTKLRRCKAELDSYKDDWYQDDWYNKKK